MSSDIPYFHQRHGRCSRVVVDAFLGGDGLPFADVLTAERIQRILAKHGCLFGPHGIYTTAIMVWSFLGQVLRDGKQASSSRLSHTSFAIASNGEPPQTMWWPSTGHFRIDAVLVATP